MKYFYSLAVLLVTLCMIACSEDEKNGGGTQPFLEMETKALTFNTEGGVKALVVKTNYTDWTVTVPEKDRSWCNATTKKTDGSQLINVDLTANDDLEIRSTTLTVTAGEKRESVTVTQLGTAPQIVLTVTNINIGFAAQTVAVEVVSNVEYIATPKDKWLQLQEDQSKAMRTETEYFVAERNLDPQSRMGTIEFTQVGNDKLKATAFINQSAAKPGDGSGSIAADVQIPISRGEDTSHEGADDISKSFDGDLNTIYHSNWGNSGANYFPITLTYYFDTPAEQLDYLVYVPRQSGSNGHFKEFELLISTQATPAFTKYGDYNFNGSGSASSIMFRDGGLQQVKGVRFIVKSGAGDGQGFASCAEMQFFKKAETSSALSAIFVDEICSALKPEVTQEQIDQIENPFFKNLANMMYAGVYDTEFRVQEYKAYQHPDIQSRTHKTNPYSLHDNPTGIAVTENEEVVIMVENTHNQALSILVQNLDEGFGGASYALKEGLNKITASKSGLLYVMYHTQTGTEPPIKIHIASGTVNGYYDITKHTEADWRRLLNGATNKYFDALGKYSHMTYTTAAFKSATGNNGRELVEATDQITHLQHELMGLYKYNKVYNNRMYMHVVYGDAYMYATSYRTAYHENTLSEIANPTKLKSGAIWGPAHEIGHCNQTRPGFLWIGMTEVTNNLMSQYVQRKIANDSRLQNEDMGGGSSRYQKAFTSMIAAGIPHGDEGDVFCKLVPLWQLYLYMTEILGQRDFYPDIYEWVRNEPNPDTDGKCQLNFIRLACRSAQLDLTDFFTAWGFLTPINKEIDDYSKRQLTVTDQMIADLKDEIAAEGYSKPQHDFRYLCENNMTLFTTNQPVVAGTATLSGNKATMQNWKSVVAFESYDSAGVLKQVTQGGNSITVPSGGSVKAVGVNGVRIPVTF